MKKKYGSTFLNQYSGKYKPDIGGDNLTLLCSLKSRKHTRIKNEFKKYSFCLNNLRFFSKKYNLQISTIDRFNSAFKKSK